MRILLVQESDWLERGPHQQHHLMERLRARGHEIKVIDYDIMWRTKRDKSFISHRSVFLARGKAEEGSKILVIRPGMLRAPIFDYASILFTHGVEVYRQMKEFAPDVVMGMGIINTYIAMRLCRKLGVPFVYYLIDSLHALIPERGLKIVGKALESRVVRFSDLVFVINERLKRYAVDMGAHPSKVAVLGAGVDLKRMNPMVDGSLVREKYEIGKNEIVLFFMGWLYVFSGIKEVAASLMNYNGGKKIRLMALGKGDLYDELRRMKREGLGEKLVLVDWQPYDEVPKYIAAADICLLPAYNNEIMRDIVPIKMYEYMACGKPVISTRLPGIMKEFGHNNGVMYVDQPTEVMRKVIDLYSNDGSIKDFGIKSREFVERYSWNKIADEFEDVLMAVANRRTIRVAAYE